LFIFNSYFSIQLMFPLQNLLQWWPRSDYWITCTVEAEWTTGPGPTLESCIFLLSVFMWCHLHFLYPCSGRWRPTKRKHPSLEN
jgi:hypothetical protein